mgnify:CR=1 FL=1
MTIKNKMFSTVVLGGFLATSIQAQGLSSESIDFNMDFKEPMQTVKTMSLSAKPMAKHMTEGMKELKSLMAKVKADPNALNRAKFELGFAKVTQTIVKDIDKLIVHEDDMKFAFEDISAEVSRVQLGFKHKEKDIKLSAAEAVEKETKLKEKVKAEAQRIKDLGEEKTAADERALRRLLGEYKRAKTFSKLKASQQKQYAAYNKRMADLLAKLGGSTGNLDGLYDGLKGTRKALSDIVGLRREMEGINKGIADSKVLETFKQIEKLDENLGQFANLLSEMEFGLNDFAAGGDGTDVDASGKLDLNKLINL